jgi:hypothetical protein
LRISITTLKGGLAHEYAISCEFARADAVILSLAAAV